MDYHLIYFVIAQRGHLNILTEDMDKSLGVALENLLGWSPSKSQSPLEGDN